MAESVKAVIRCRPFSEKEKDSKCKRVVEMNTSLSLSLSPLTFNFFMEFNIWILGTT